MMQIFSAQLAETGFYKAVRIKSFEAMLIRTLVGARTQLLTITTQLTNQIRGVLKTFGLIAPKGIGCVFVFNVFELLEGQTQLAQIILPLLDVCRVSAAEFGLKTADDDDTEYRGHHGDFLCRGD